MMTTSRDPEPWVTLLRLASAVWAVALMIAIRMIEMNGSSTGPDFERSYFVNLTGVGVYYVTPSMGIFYDAAQAGTEIGIALLAIDALIKKHWKDRAS
jgi:hypothetical protein